MVILYGYGSLPNSCPKNVCYCPNGKSTAEGESKWNMYEYVLFWGDPLGKSKLNGNHLKCISICFS